MSRVTLLQLMNDGGWVMWLLLLFSITTLAVTVQRALVLRRATGNAAPLLAEVSRALRAGSSRKLAASTCSRAGSAVGSLLAAGLLREESDPEALEGHLESVALRELRRLTRGLTVLAAVATTAPLLGFLGTVTGMMESFGSIVGHGMHRPDLVALGIKEALTTTAAGLIVAVPAQLLHQWLRSRVDRIEGELEAAGNGLIDLLCRAGV
jgi:biopolymer transport protein ExbB